MSDHDGCIRQIAGLKAENEKLRLELSKHYDIPKLEYVTDERDQLKAEVELLKKSANWGAKAAREDHERWRDQLAERVRILEEALEWYADPDKYCSQSGDDPENWYLATVYGFGVIADKAKSALAASNHKPAIPENCDHKTEASNEG